MDDHELLTIDEVAAILRLHTDTVRKHLEVGRIPSIRIGSRVRIPRKTLFDHMTFSSKQSA
ncbi:MAG: helix-turn-helix domain-containing protein [Dehalococcoidia bacterium]